jgi:hypothetical protein
MRTVGRYGGARYYGCNSQRVGVNILYNYVQWTFSEKIIKVDQKVSVFWGAMKNSVYSNNCSTIDDLKKVITEYIQNVDRAILNTVFKNTVRLVNKCLETGGGHFEHYLSLSVLQSSVAQRLFDHPVQVTPKFNKKLSDIWKCNQNSGD